MGFGLAVIKDAVIKFRIETEAKDASRRN